MGEGRFFAFPICLRLRPPLILCEGENPGGVESGGGEAIFGRDTVPFLTTGYGESGEQVSEAEAEEGHQDRQSYDHAFWHRGSFQPAAGCGLETKWPGGNRPAHEEASN
jgi:hypothetical protein